mgnify:CR=1 FL=1
MADRIELQARIDFRKAALTKLRAAYLALVDGGAKSYMIDDRQVTKLDIPALKREIESAEAALDELERRLAGHRARKAFGVIPRDW